MSAEHDLPAQNPRVPEFWDQRFRTGVTPWDAGRVPNALQAFVAAYRGPRRVLVPGCGSAWEARYLADRGWDVTAVDFSTEAIARARTTLGPHAARVLHADFFAFDAGPPFDVVYERTFLCAMPRDRWPQYAARVAQLLVPGRLLAGLFFFSDEPKGPPFGASPGVLDALLSSFERTEDRPVDDSIPLFKDRERWQVWRRTG